MTLSQEEIQKSLKASLWDGAFWSITVGFAEIFFSPFALWLGAKDLYLGILATVPIFLGSLSQLACPRVLRRLGSRKKLVLLGVLGQALLLIFMMGCFYLPRFKLSFLLIVTCFYWVAWMLLTPAWQSWMGDLVPESGRGRYFSERNRIIQLATFLALLAAGGILGLFQKENGEMAWGFFTLLSVGVLGRLFSFYFISKQVDLNPAEDSPPSPGLLQFLKQVHSNHYGLFVLFGAFFSAGINMAAPYFIPYMLQIRRFSYLEFVGLMAVMVGFKFIFLPAWGRFSDRYGTRKLLVLATLLTSVLPFLWLISHHLIFLLLVQAVGGLAIAGFELCLFNYMLDATESKNRLVNAVYLELFIGVGMVAGSVGGGFILRFLLSNERAYLWVFFASGLFRLLLSAIFLPKIREPRAVPPISYGRLFWQIMSFSRSVAD